MPTKHIEAQTNEIAEKVIMTGDPIRCKKIAKEFLTNPKLVSRARMELCYTGEYKGKMISIMSSGMGNASMGIYSYELFNFYDVKKIIRIGTCGTKNVNLNLGEVLISKEVYTDTNYLNYFEKNKNKPIFCSENLLNNVVKLFDERNIDYHMGKTFCTDTFYSHSSKFEKICDNIEMESASLYLNAQNSNKEALCITTITDIISDDPKKSKSSSIKNRSNFLKNIVEVALDV